MKRLATTVDQLKGYLADSTVEEILLEEKQYEIDETLNIHRSVNINGQGATIISHNGSTFSIMASDVTIHSINIEGGADQITIDAVGKEISNIVISNMLFLNYQHAGIWIGSSKSNSSIEKVSIKNSKFIKEKQIDGVFDILLNSAASKDGKDISNTLVSHVHILNNYFAGLAWCNFLGVVTMSVAPGMENKTKFVRCNIHHVTLENNNLSGSYDTAIAQMANFINTEDSYFDYFDVINNTIAFNITGIASTAGSPLMGTAKNVTARHIRFIKNRIIEREGGCGEPSVAMTLAAANLDYISVNCYDCLMEHVKICDNEVIGTTVGIRLEGASAMVDVDTPCEMKGNVLRDVCITGNHLKSVEECFQIFGVRAQGRRTDWNWGGDHKMQYWQKPLENNNVITMSASDNKIQNVVIEDNILDGYRYMYSVVGAWARGHGIFSGNKATDIIIRNNFGTHGEDHILVENTWLQDWAHNGGANEVNSSLKTSFVNKGAFVKFDDEICRREY